MSEQSPERYYMPSSSNETSPMSNEDIIAQKILKRVEIAKMTRQLKEKLFKAGLQVRDQQHQQQGLVYQDNQYPHLHQHHLNSSNSNSPQSSPSKSLSEDVTNNITATAISNIQNSKLATPTRSNFNFDNANLSISALTPIISPLKRKSSSIYRSTESNRHFLYENMEEDMMSPLKKMHNGALNSSPYANATSPYQFTRGSLLQSPPRSLHSNHLQPPKTPPQKQVDLFKPLAVLPQDNQLTKPKQKQRKSGSKRKVLGSSNAQLSQQQAQAEAQMQQQPDIPSQYQQMGSFPLEASDKGPSQSSLLMTPKSSNRIKEFTTPNKNNNDDLGADLLLFLSNSPARTFNNKDSKDLSKVLAIPTTPKSSGSALTNISLLESTPLKNQLPPQYFISPNANNTPSTNAFLQPLLGTPMGNNGVNNGRFLNPDTPNNRQSNKMNINLNRTPGFSMSDYINFTPSPRVTRTPDYNHLIYTKPMLNNYSKELNMITSIKEDED